MKNYDSLMLQSLSIESFFVKKISTVAKFYYTSDFVYSEDSLKGPELEVEPDILDEGTKFIKSYFTYQPLI